jgi:hypothetical protein
MIISVRITLILSDRLADLLLRCGLPDHHPGCRRAEHKHRSIKRRAA